MTRNSTISHSNIRRIGTALLATASGIALSTMPVSAQEVIFSDNGTAAITPGVPVIQTSGLTQVRMPNGTMLSFNGSAQYTINADSSVDLISGSVTVAGSDAGETAINMPDGAVAHVSGATNAGVFTVTPEGQSTGQTLTGMIHVTRFSARRDFDAGEQWTSNGRRSLRQVVSNGPRATPPVAVAANGPEVKPLEDGGPAAAAANGIPVSLGDALAAAGASSDIIAAARRVELAAGNPDLDTFPSGDLALLVAVAGQFEGLNGGTPFPQAQADIITTYLGYLADGGSGAQFLTAYAGFLNQYLALVRTGALPSSFDATGVADINAFLAFQSRRGALGDLATQDQVLAEAYLAFLANGGNVDLFTAQFTDLIESYFAFVRAGGDPADFTGGSAALLDQYIVFLNDSDLLVQLDEQNQALLAAYLANGGLGFVGDYQAALEAYYTFLEQGGLPSGYTDVDLTTLQAYIAALQSAGLLSLLGDNAQFYADYLAYLQGGGNPDTYIGLPALNLPAFAEALNAYAAFLATGGLPSDFSATDLAQLATYIEALRNAGQLQALLGNNAALLDAYFAYLATGANADLFSGLPIYADYVAALNAYFAFLAAGGLPDDYTALTEAQISAYLTALAAAGGLDLQIGGDVGAFFASYLAFLQGGGDPQNFAGLPLYLDYLAAVEAFYAFLLNGGIPSGYTVLTQAQIQAYLAALAAAGLLNSTYTGDELAFYLNYLNFLAGGGTPDNFTGLPGSGNSGGNVTYAVASGADGFYTSPNASGTFSTNGVSFDNQGQPTGIPGQPANEMAVDIAFNSDSIIGRFISTNQHYAVVNPITGNLPASGTIDYELLAATSPTYSDDASTTGTFTANLTIGFGASLTYGIDGTITMPDATYTFASPGRANGQLATPQVAAADFFVIRPVLSQSGRACQSSNCYLNMFGGIGGADGRTVGFSYQSRDNFNLEQPFLQGAAIFAAVAPTAHAPAAVEMIATAATWARWDSTTSGGANSSPPGGSDAGTPSLVPLGDGFAPGGVTYSAEQLLMLENHLAGQIN